VCALRGQLVPVHAPTHVLGVGVGSVGVALVLVGDPPFALAADDVEDTFTIEPRALHDAPGVDDPDGVLVGVARDGGRLVGVLDAPALAAASLAPVSPEPR
jgi:chemotaxis signal transduction protein